MHSAQNLSLSLLILMISWVGVSNKLLVSEIRAILGVQIIEIRVFRGFWVSFLPGCSKFCSLLLLERLEICRNIYMYFRSFGQF